MSLLVLMLMFSVLTLGVVAALVCYLRRRLAADRRAARKRSDDVLPLVMNEEK